MVQAFRVSRLPTAPREALASDWPKSRPVAAPFADLRAPAFPIASWLETRPAAMAAGPTAALSPDARYPGTQASLEAAFPNPHSSTACFVAIRARMAAERMYQSFGAALWSAIPPRLVAVPMAE